MENYTNDSSMYIGDEERGNMRMKKFMEKNNMKTAEFVIVATSKETDKGRNVIDYIPYAIPIEHYDKGNMPESLKKREKAPRKCKTHSLHSWKEVPMDDDTAELCCEICENEGDDFDNATDFYRYVHKKVFVDTGKCRDFSFTDKDKSQAVARGYWDLFSGNKFQDIVNNHICSIGGKIKNDPTDEAWIRSDYNNGNISSMNVIKYGSRGGVSPIYTFDTNTNPDNPYNKENNNPEIKRLREMGLPEEEIEVLMRYRNNNKNN